MKPAEILEKMFLAGQIPEAMRAATHRALSGKAKVKDHRAVLDRANAESALLATLEQQSIIVPSSILLDAIRVMGTSFFLHNDLSDAEFKSYEALREIVLHHCGDPS